MISLKLLAEKIKGLANKRGYGVDCQRLEDTLKKDERRLRYYKHVFSTKEGCWVLTDLMVEGGLLSASEADSSFHLSYLEGKRSMAIRIASSIGLDFEQLIQMYSRDLIDEIEERVKDDR